MHAIQTQRTLQIFEFNSWIVGLLMGVLQSVFGKRIVPDSKVIYLQTLFNPLHPLTVGNKLLNDLKETTVDESRLLAQTAKDENYGLDTILDKLKPKLVDGLSELADSGVLDKFKPLINLTVENVVDMDYSEGPANSTLLGGELKYHLVDLVDYDSYTKQVHHSNRTYHSKTNELGEFIDLLLSKRQVNSSQEFGEFAGDVVANGSSLIDKADDKQTTSHKPDNAVETQEPAITVSNDAANRTAAEFREMQSEHQSNHTSKYDGLSDSYNQTAPNAAQSEGSHQLINILIKDGDEQQPHQSNRIASSPSGSNSTDNFDTPIVSVVTCDEYGKNCKEEEIEENPLTNETHYDEPIKQPVKRPSRVRLVFKKLLNCLKNLIEKPVAFLNETVNWLKDLIVRDARLISRMIRTLFAARSQTCRHKFLCLFASFFSSHTPDFVKANISSAVEGYYFSFLDAANQYESLSALLYGFVGFDCNEFYSDDKHCSY